MKDKINNLISHLFYAYFALMPLLALLLFYFSNNYWTAFMVKSGLSQTFTLSAIFLAGIFSPAIILKTPLPRNKWILLFSIVITPVSIFINYLLGQKLDILEIVIFDYLLQILAYIIADIALFVTNKSLFIKINNKESKLLLDSFGIALIFSFYGYITLTWIEKVDLQTILIYAFSLISTSYAFYKIFTFDKDDMTKNEKLIRTKMNSISIFSLLASWAFLFYLFIKLAFLTY